MSEIDIDELLFWIGVISSILIVASTSITLYRRLHIKRFGGKK